MTVIYFKKGNNPYEVTVEFSYIERSILRGFEALTSKTAPEILREALIQWFKSVDAEFAVYVFEAKE